MFAALQASCISSQRRSSPFNGIGVFPAESECSLLDGSGGGVNAQVARRTMLLSVSLAYFASAFLFFLASKAPNGSSL